jgi:hypothetical protein
MIAAIALALFRHRFGMLLNVVRQRPANVIALLKTAMLVTPHVAFVMTGIDQFTVAGMFFALHFKTPPCPDHYGCNNCAVYEYR